jgi:hypothetical protein
MSQTGYLDQTYADSLEEHGAPVRLSGCGGFLLERTIPGTAERDAVGLYPLFCCVDWTALPADLEALADEVVSVVLVTDPFGGFDARALAAAFSHGLVPYKDHIAIDLAQPLERSASAHHRRNARCALNRVTVEEVAEPIHYWDTWCQLYAELSARHRLKGMSLLSRKAFERQLRVPGLCAIRAADAEGITVGMVLWYCQGEVAYYHLGAYSQRGYQDKASFALFWRSAEMLRARVRWLNLGAGAGINCDGTDGLTRFKRGWSPLVRTSYLGRHVAQPARYADLCRGAPATEFFPAYRAAAAAVA